MAGRRSRVLTYLAAVLPCGTVKLSAYSKTCIYKKCLQLGLHLLPTSCHGALPQRLLLAVRSVWRIATDWTVQGSNFIGARIYARVQSGPGADPASCTVSTGTFPEVKRPMRGVNHAHHLVPRLKKVRSYTSTTFYSFHSKVLLRSYWKRLTIQVFREVAP